MRLGWKNFVSGWISLTIGLIPIFIYIAINSASPLMALSASGFVLLIGGFFGIAIGWPVESALLPGIKNLTLFKIYGIYTLIGLAVSITFSGLMTIRPNGGDFGFLVWWLAIALFMFVPFIITMLIARGLYPLLHMKLFNLEAPNTPAKVNLNAA